MYIIFEYYKCQNISDLFSFVIKIVTPLLYKVTVHNYLMTDIILLILFIYFIFNLSVILYNKALYNGCVNYNLNLKSVEF